MSKSLRIVLVDPLGDVLFSGESLSMIPREEPAEERCPDTMRSATTHESGMYPSMAFVEDGDPETLPETDEIRSSRPRIRAA